MYRKLTLLVLMAAVLTLTGCPKPPKDYNKALPPGQLALRKLDPSQYPDFTQACIGKADLRQAIDRSLSYFAKQSSQKYYPYGEVTHTQAVATLNAFKDLLGQNLPPEQMNRFIQEHYDVYISVGCDDLGTVLYTGYYTPIFDGSETRTGPYQYPLYKAPAGLAKGPDGAILGEKNPDGSIRPYPPRTVIESTGMLKGSELVWLKDRFEVYIAHVQGSAKVRLANGKLTTVGYAANNGYDYHSIGQELVKDGKIEKNELSLARMISYFREHPDQLDQYVNRNPRFVFFQFDSGEPRGSLNEPVTTYRSIATDKSIYPRGCLAFITTELPKRTAGGIENSRSDAFVLDQDTGGGIRAAGRCDVYMGVGPDAGELAGRTYNEGKLYYLFVKQ